MSEVRFRAWPPKKESSNDERSGTEEVARSSQPRHSAGCLHAAACLQSISHACPVGGISRLIYMVCSKQNMLDAFSNEASFELTQCASQDCGTRLRAVECDKSGWATFDVQKDGNSRVVCPASASEFQPHTTGR